MIRGITFSEQLNTSNDFAHFQNTFLDGTSGITKGCKVTYTTDNIYISSGYFVISGRFVQIVGQEEIITPRADSGDLFCNLVFEVDLSKFNTVNEFEQGKFKIITSVTNYPSLIQQDLDADGTVYQMPFAKFKKTLNGINNFQDTSISLEVSEIWKRIAARNQEYETEFQTFFTNQKQEIIAKKQEYETDVRKKIQELKTFFDAEKTVATNYFNVNKEEFETFFQVEEQKILKMIADLEKQGFIKKEDLESEKEDLKAVIDGFSSLTTIFHQNGNITEIGQTGTKETHFIDNNLIEEILNKPNGEIVTKLTFFVKEKIYEILDNELFFPNNSLILYNAGNEYNTTTGGFVAYQWDKNYTYGYTVKTQQYLEFGDNNPDNYGCGAFCSKNKIDFSKYSYLYFDYEIYDYNASSCVMTYLGALPIYCPMKNSVIRSGRLIERACRINEKKSVCVRAINRLDMTMVNEPLYIVMYGIVGANAAERLQCRVFHIWAE